MTSERIELPGGWFLQDRQRALNGWTLYDPSGHPKALWPEETARAFAAALQQQQPQAPAGGEWQVPDGWRLVPIKPTRKMMGVFCDGVDRLIADELEVDIWGDMLAAAPTPDQGSAS